jgi:glycyl-tRNA synthetase beta subunit
MQTLVTNGVRLDLPAAVAAAAAEQPVKVTTEVQNQVVTFVTRRLEQLLVDGGCGPEPVKAALAERGFDPALAAQTARDLQVRSLLSSLSIPFPIPLFSVSPFSSCRCATSYTEHKPDVRIRRV